MGIYFRTGENTAAGISWPTYIFLVLPFQLLYGFAKMLVLAFKWLAIAIVTAVMAVVHAVRGHEENRPPTP